MRRRQLSAELTHPTAKDVGEDGLLAAIVHLREGQVIEMTCQAWSNSIPSPSRRSHGTDKINIHQLLKRTLRSVKAGPNAELKPKHPNLPRKFMYLSTGQLLQGHWAKIWVVPICFLSYQPWWSIHCRSSSMGGCAPNVSSMGMFKSSIKKTKYRPTGGPNTPFLL